MKSHNVLIIPKFRLLIRTTIGIFLVLLIFTAWKTISVAPIIIPVQPFLVKAQFNENDWDCLPNLDELSWPELKAAPFPAGRRFANGTIKPLPPALNPVMSKAQFTLSKHLLAKFSELMFQNDLGDRFFLNGGTLVGSFQHHDIIPWDDDVDVLVDVTVRPTVQRILQVLSPNYQVTVQGVRDKFYTKLLNESDDDMDIELSRKSSQYVWGWPYLDIGYFEHNETHLWDISSQKAPNQLIDSTIVFPLVFRPLGKNWYPAPFNTLAYLRHVYGNSGGCAVFGYSHIIEGSGPSGRAPCWSLGKKYAFVQHLLADSRYFIIDDSTWKQTMVVVEESLVYRTHRGPLVIHSLRLPTILETTEVNTYGFADPPVFH
ncbi:unnamed protein product [Echinostoma caproni]|uniref:Lipopolysaccharide choline phosphotransferase protein n=1 Tax=Echinostoma caproni TaxID=27848 RepID=A0A183AVG1_9TREM|nr:unnamed protein product [Echinostoma caproni]